MSRTKTVQEIREEYERLVKEREERRLEQRTNPKGTISCGINATELFDSGDEEYRADWSRSLPFEVTSITISQSIDAPLSTTESCSLSGNCTVQNGRGNGHLTLSLRRIISDKTWMELQFTIGQGPLITLKGFRTVSKRSFCTANTFVHFGQGGMKPGIEIGKLSTSIAIEFTYKLFSSRKTIR